MADKDRVSDLASILIIDDSLVEIDVIKDYLKEESYQVVAFTNGFDALKAIQESSPDIILTDVVMPEIDGFQICAILKRNMKTKHIPVVILTSLSDPVNILKGLYSGANNFIIKPFNKEYLLSQICHILNLKSLYANTLQEEFLEVDFEGHKYKLTPERMQIVNLLLSTVDVTIQKNRELEEANSKLRHALNEIQTLHHLIPICAKCKKFRDDSGSWQHIETYIKEFTTSDVTHTLCPDCDKELYEKKK